MRNKIITFIKLESRQGVRAEETIFFCSSNFSRCSVAEYEMISVIEFYSCNNETVRKHIFQESGITWRLNRKTSRCTFLFTLANDVLLLATSSFFSAKKNRFSFDSWLLHSRHLDIRDVKAAFESTFAYTELFIFKIKILKFNCLFWKKPIRYSAINFRE